MFSFSSIFGLSTLSHFFSFDLIECHFVDQVGGENNYSLGWTKFTKILEKMEGIPLEKQQELIIKELNNYQNGTAQIDDITMLGFKLF